MEKTEGILELPLFLLHRVLSCLPRKDATRTSVLSRRWNSVWDSFPIIRFDDINNIKERRGTPVYAEKFEQLLNSVDNTLLKFSQNKLRVDTLHLNLRLIDRKPVPMVDTWIPLALHSGASCISFTVYIDLTNGGHRDRYYPLLETTFLVNKSISASSGFYSLQSLKLTMVYLSENIIRDITRNCPNISFLSLWHFRGLKTLELSNLHKLERLSIVVRFPEIESVSVDAPSLKYFEFTSYVEQLPCVIQLTSCHDLKQLHISKSAITNGLFNSYLARFPLLEDLYICECHMLQRIRIFSAQKLESLEICNCNALEVVQLNAPNLSKFEFSTGVKMPKLLSENVVPWPKSSGHLQTNMNGRVDSFWFLKLREFLGVLAQTIHFSLYVVEKEVSFDSEAFRDVEIPPPVQVDHLELSSWLTRAQLDCATTLMDGLLWSCHPKTISICSYSLFENSCIMVLCEKLLGNKQPLLCCKSSHFKCWRHSLKDAKIERFGGIEDYQSLHLNKLLDSISLLTENDKVRFKLDWDI